MSEQEPRNLEVPQAEIPKEAVIEQQVPQSDISESVLGTWQDAQKIEVEANKALDSGIGLTHQALRDAGLSSLSHAITRYYPGGRCGLRIKLESEEGNYKKPDGYYDEPSIIEEEARKALSLGVAIDDRSLREHKLNGLSYAVSANYPGGFYGLREKLGLKEIDPSKPDGYWYIAQNIAEEAKKAIEEGWDIRPTVLRKANKSSLAEALSRYPGGLVELRKSLGLNEPVRRANGYWKNIETIENEARKAKLQGIDIHEGPLRASRLSSLARAIYKFYPGGLVALREKLGLNEHTISPDQADEFFRRLEVEI